MFRRYLSSFLVIGVVCVVAISAAFTASKRQEQNVGKQTGKIVDYKTSEGSSDDTTERKIKRDARNKRYDKQGTVVEPPPQAGGRKISTKSSYIARLPALPIALSDAIIIGEVTDAQAHLSDDKSGVYTETTVKVDLVIKNNSNVPINNAETIEAHRSGGRVRFPSGKVFEYSVHRQGIPETGRRYLLFLKYHPQGESFGIITGYELRAGRVFLLDGEGDSPKASLLPQFARFKNMDESAFLSELQLAVQEGVSR